MPLQGLVGFMARSKKPPAPLFVFPVPGADDAKAVEQWHKQRVTRDQRRISGMSVARRQRGEGVRFSGTVQRPFQSNLPLQAS